MTGDRAIRAATAAVVLAVAAFAAVVSYSHVYTVGRSHGQSGADAVLLPLSVDGLIVAASLVLLHEARNRRRAPLLARAMLVLGVGATVAANIAYGLPFGTLGSLVSAWPAVAFIGTVEMVMHLVRRARTLGASTPAPERGSEAAPEIAPERGSEAAPEADAERTSGTPAERARRRARKRSRQPARSAPATAEDAEREFMVELTSGAVPSLRQIRARLHIGQDRAKEIQRHLETLTPAGPMS